MQTLASRTTFSFTAVLQHSVAEEARAYMAEGCPLGRTVEAFAQWLSNADGEWVDPAALYPYLEKEGLLVNGRLKTASL